jgi:hypothetical protein
MATRTEMITYAKRIAYLRDPNKISVEVFNNFREKLDLSDINRVLKEKYGKSRFKSEFSCGHPRTHENIHFYNGSVAKCRTCHAKAVAEKAGGNKTVETYSRPRKQNIEFGMYEQKTERLISVCREIFDIPKTFKVTSKKKTEDEAEFIAAVCLLSKRCGVRWADLERMKFISGTVGIGYWRRGEDMYKTYKPFQRLVDACIRHIGA